MIKIKSALKWQDNREMSKKLKCHFLITKQRYEEDVSSTSLPNLLAIFHQTQIKPIYHVSVCLKTEPITKWNGLQTLKMSLLTFFQKL